MPAARRYALLRWARRARAFVFEDDYDGVPLRGPADSGARWTGSRRRHLLRHVRKVALSVLPPRLSRASTNARPSDRRCKWLADRGSSRVVEGAIGELLATGHYDRHIRRMQRRYRARCAALERSLQKHLGECGRSAGQRRRTPPRRVAPRAAAAPSQRSHRGVPGAQHRRVSRGSLFNASVCATGLLLGYGLVEIDDIDRGCEGMAEAYGEVIN